MEKLSHEQMQGMANFLVKEFSSPFLPMGLVKATVTHNSKGEPELYINIGPRDATLAADFTCPGAGTSLLERVVIEKCEPCAEAPAVLTTGMCDSPKQEELAPMNEKLSHPEFNRRLNRLVQNSAMVQNLSILLDKGIISQKEARAFALFWVL